MINRLLIKSSLMRWFLPTRGFLLTLCGICRGGELAVPSLLVTTARTGNTGIFAVDQDTGDARNLTRHPAEDRYSMWSPDGSRVAFTSNRDGAYNLHVMDADEGNVRQLTHEKSPAVCYMPRGDGEGKRSKREHSWSE